MSRSLGRTTSVIVVAFAAISCRDSRGDTDSTLARDLSLANQSSPATPQLTDTALTSTPAKAPGTKRSQPPRNPAPVDAVPAPVPVTTVEVPAPAPTPTPPPFKGLAAGTALDLRTRSPVCTTNLPGDKITATVATNVIGENGATVPAGTVVVLEVVEIIPGDKPENARVTLRIRSILVNDQPVNVPSDVAVTSELERRQVARDKGADRRKVVGGAVAGAVIGQIMGKDTKSTVTGAVVGAAAGAAVAAGSRQYDACLPAGGSLRATTTQPVPING